MSDENFDVDAPQSEPFTAPDNTTPLPVIPADVNIEQTTLKEASEQGYLGTKVDPRPNSDYTLKK